MSTDFRLNNCLFGSVNLTKNADLDKYKYSGYSIGFDSCSEVLFTDRSFGKNVIIFGADMRLSVQIDNKNNDILVLDKGSAQGCDDATLTEETKYSVNFTQSRKRFVLSLYYDGSHSFLFVNATKIYQSKAKDSVTKDYALCLDNILGNIAINNMKNNRIKRNCNFFFCWF